MNYVMLIIGILIVLAVLYDVIQTALRLGQRGGPLTLRVASRLWRIALRFPRLLQASGVLILLSIVVVWVLFMWLGWSLIFASSDRGVVLTATGVQADIAGKIYFAGYTVFTLGNGEYQPVGVWRIPTVIAAATGLMIATLSITYLIPLISAAVEKRTLAGRISLMGRSVSEIVDKLVSPDSEELRREIASLPQHLLLLKERHLAYPVLHYFQSRDAESVIAVNLAVLNEALLVVSEGVLDADPSLAAAAAKFRSGTERLVMSLEPWFVTEEPSVPNPPPLQLLAASGLRIRGREEFEARIVRSGELRRQLRWMVQDTGWSWTEHVVATAPQDR